jgi:hypothetical protein
MALLDGDRFEGKLREGVHTTDTSDLMWRITAAPEDPSGMGIRPP